MAQNYTLPECWVYPKTLPRKKGQVKFPSFASLVEEIRAGHEIEKKYMVCYWAGCKLRAPENSCIHVRNNK